MLGSLCEKINFQVVFFFFFGLVLCSGVQVLSVSPVLDFPARSRCCGITVDSRVLVAMFLS